MMRVFPSPSYACLRLLVAAMGLIFWAGWAHAQDVSTRLSAREAAVGEPVQLSVVITDARSADLPQSLSVNGLRINLAGRQSQFQMGTGMKPTSTLTFTYMVVPQFEGEFTIPSFEVSVQGRIYKTQPMQLSVSGNARVPANPALPMPQSPNAPPQPSGLPDKLFFAETVLSKRKAYVGEVVPVELRFYFSDRVSGQLGDRPTFSGEGFTVQRFSNPQRREQIVNDSNYVVFTYQTSITPVKAGKLEIPAATFNARLQLPGRSAGGIQDLLGMFADVREVTLESRPTSIDVLPLPSEGRPADFSGAIGNFTMEATVKPAKVAAGEPVTLTVAVSGQGNLDAMGSPTLTEDEGWRTYPPSDKVVPDDAIGFSGKRVFDFTLIAREDQTRTPGVSFNFFDPSSGKYETLTAAPLTVEAKGGSAAPAVATGQPSAATNAPSPIPVQTEVAPTTPPTGASDWQPLFLRRDFLVSNAALAVAWLALFGFLALRRFEHSESGRRLAAKRHTKSLLNRLGEGDPAGFYDRAVEFLRERLDCDALTLPERLSRLSLDPAVAESLRTLLARQTEARYGITSTRTPSPEERTTFLAALQSIDRHAR